MMRTADAAGVPLIRLARTIAVSRDEPPLGDPVGPVAISPDGRTIAASVSNHVRLYDCTSGAELDRLGGQNEVFEWLAFSPDGDTLAWPFDWGIIDVWSIHERKEVGVIRGHEEPAFCVAFSPDGRRLASGSRDKTVKLWDARTLESVATMLGHRDYVVSVAFSPDGRSVASGSSDGTVRLWDAATGAEIACLEAVVGVGLASEYVAFHPGGRLLAVAGPGARGCLWNLETRVYDQIVFERNGFRGGGEGLVTRIGFSPDGRWLAATTNDGLLRVWNLEIGLTGEYFRYNHRTGEPVVGAIFSPDSQVLFSTCLNRIYIWVLAHGI